MEDSGRLIAVLVLPLVLAAGADTERSASAAATSATMPQGKLPRASQPYHGLTALADRNAWRPPDRFKQDDAYLSERVIYGDSVTGHEVWQMTVHPGVDRVAYYDLPEWNADGSLLAFSTDRSPQELWVMNADGGRLRPMPLGQLPIEAVRQGYWSVREPNIWFCCQSDGHGSRVLELDVRDGTSRAVARTARPHLRLEPPHPLEKHFLLAHQETSGGECEVVVLSRDGSEQVVPIGGRFHRLRFTKADNLMIFFNRDDPRTQWVIMPDGSGRKQLPDAGVHPDWTWDGSELTYFFDRSVYAMTPEGRRRQVFRTGSGGHGGPSLDGRFFIADQSGGDYPGSIVLGAMDGSGRVWPVAYHGSRMWSHAPESQCHPDHHSTHPHPSFSPDGTKAVFSSYFSRVFTDVHVVICRYPDPPRNLTVRHEAGRAVLSWTEPERHREIAGYLVFRQSAGGSACEQVGRAPVWPTTWTDAGPPSAEADYKVVAVEHSGLAGWPASSARDRTRPTAPLDSTDRPRIEKKPPAPPTSLIARAMDSFHVDLRWSMPGDPSVCSYHVYSLSSQDVPCTQANRIASPAERRMVDWGRPPGSTQYYRVTAVDWFGNESVASDSASVVMPAMAIVNIELEPADAVAGEGTELVDSGIAEVGRVAAIKADSLSEDVALTWRVGIPIPAEYAVWVQQLVPASSTGRTAHLKWGDGESWEWRVFGPFDRYVWWPVTARPNSTPHPFRFDASATTLQVRLPGEGVRLAKVLVTNDATRMPAEFGGAPVSGIRPAGSDGPIKSKGTVLFEEPFANLDDWYHEGGGKMSVAEPGTLRLEISGSRQGSVGSHAFCRKDLPDRIAVEYDMKVLTRNGLVIAFVAMAGLKGEDLITGGLPARTGIFADYVGANAALRSYHVSLSRYNDKGVHTGVSNWRRNPGLHLMNEGPDVCKEIQRWYRIRIVKNGKHLQLQVNGRVAHEFVDPDQLPTPLPTAGKFGFRAIGSDVQVLIRDFSVTALE